MGGNTKVIGSKRKKSILYMFFSILLTVFFYSSYEAFASNDETLGKIKNLGSPNHSIGILASSIGEGPGGIQAIFTGTNGSPAKFNVINAETGERVTSHVLEGAEQSWGTVIDPEGNVYVSGGANLYKYNPKEDELINLGRAIDTETTVWNLTVSEDGKIFGGTYPNGKVFMYDPVEGRFTDLGSMKEGAGYARSIGWYQDKLYIGMGIAQHLIVYDTKTGEKNEFVLPEENKDDGYVYNLDIHDHYLFIRLSDSSTLLIYDLSREEWLDQIHQTMGGYVSTPNEKNQVFFMKENELYMYDLNNRTITNTGFQDTWSTKGFGWIKLNEQDFEGENLLSVRFNGTYWIYNPETKNYKEIQAEIDGEPIQVQSLGLGPDGNIYASGYQAGGFSYYSPSNDEIIRFTGFGQAENMFASEKYLYLGVYPDAIIYQYDPEIEFDHDPTQVENATNPRVLFSLEDFKQDRPFAFAGGDGKIFIGTVPDYGVLGGTLSIYDEKEDEYKVFDHIVEDQSIISLAYKDGMVYGATSVYGGLDSKPTTDEAKLFIFDLEKEKTISEIVPLPGEKGIGALTFDDEGYLWGMSPGKIFKFDPDKQEVVQSKEFFSLDWENTSHYWRGAFLEFDDDGYFYGTSMGNLFKFNPITWEMTILSENASLFTRDVEGNIYFARGTELFTYIKDKTEIEPPETVKIDVEVKNADFEQETENGVIPGWTETWSSENAFYSISDQRSYKGNHSLRLEDNSQTETVAVISDPIDIVPGMDYTAQSQVYLEEGRSIFILRFYDEGGNEIESEPAYIESGHGDWQEVTVNATAPAEAVTARIYATISNYWEGIAYYDDVSLSYEAIPSDLIELKGKEEVVVEIGATYEDEGIEMIEKDIIVDIQISGEVNVEVPGSYTLTYTGYTVEGHVDQAQRTVQVIDLLDVEVSFTSDEFNIGEDSQIMLTPIYAEDYSPDITHTPIYESSNPEIVMVSEKGMVQFLKAGMTMINVKYGDVEKSIEIIVHDVEDDDKDSDADDKDQAQKDDDKDRDPKDEDQDKKPEDKDKDEDKTDPADKDRDGDQKPADESDVGKELPSTSTNMYNLLAVGILFIMISGLLIIWNRKKTQI